jgi:hypothetical protein
MNPTPRRAGKKYQLFPPAGQAELVRTLEADRAQGLETKHAGHLGSLH